MKFRTHIDGPVNINMTGMQGTIQASALELTWAFGKPRAGAAAGRTHFEWHIQFEDGQVATIYDWNQGSEPDPRDVLCWHIGARERATVEVVHQAFREGLGERGLRRVA